VAGRIKVFKVMQNASTALVRIGQTQYVANAIHVLSRLWAQVYADRPFPRDSFQERVARHFMQRPPHCLSQMSAACHESGHFLLMHIAGFGARRAEIYTLPCSGGWGGVTHSMREPWLEHPCELLHQTRVALAGPISGELFGEDSGTAADCIDEIWLARFALARAAELPGCSCGRLWPAVLTDTAKLVEFYGKEIRTVTALLSERKVISTADRLVRRILRRVDAKPVPPLFPPLSLRCENILSDIRAAFSEFNK
jgi:hypothetical protein